MSVQQLTSESFQTEALSQAGTVLVDFYADWCGPCKMLSPIVEEVAGEQNACKVYKLNVDQAPDIAEKYRVMSIPTLIVFRNGENVRQSVGVQSKQAILKMIQE